MVDIFTYLVELPDGINEAVLSCVGGYTVYIDPRQSNDGMKRSYVHALHHIQNADFEKSSVQEIESQAHK
jgi:hypothetical protein